MTTDTSNSVPATSGLAGNETGEQIHQYRVPRLDNELVTFPDEQPDVCAMLITHIDMDPTEVCNLRCSYCFKGKLTGRNMSFETAQQAVRFLVRHSGPVRNIGVSLLGGEPFVAFPLMVRWAPWAHRYCDQKGKDLKIDVTTNGTIFDQKHHDFCRQWNIGLHLSIDGLPEVQDQERRFADGTGSSAKLEENLPRILSAWRTVHARSTIVPETVSRLLDSYRYFCEKGFHKVALSLAGSDGWNEPGVLRVLDEQFRKVLEHHWQHMRSHDRYFVLTALDAYVESLIGDEGRGLRGCGAGRGTVHADTEGTLWPCHRFAGKRAHRNLLLGSVWGGFSNAVRDAFLNIDLKMDCRGGCGDCSANRFCSGSCIAANWQENADMFDPGDGHCKAIRVTHKACRDHEAQLRKREPDLWERYCGWVRSYKQLPDPSKPNESTPEKT